MAVHNGATFLADQLNSFLRQSDRNWGLIVSIDGSDDGSAEMIQTFVDARFTRDFPMQVIRGPRRGFAANFLSLIRQAADLPDSDLVALSDQDDVWLPDKLARARAALAMSGDVPTLYCGRTLVCDARLNDRRLTALLPRRTGFRNALVQNVAAGNTIVLNCAARRLVVAAAQEVDEIVSHDWWIYQLVTGAGGRVVFDPEPSLLYRQHGGNVLGENRSFRARISRIRMALNGTYRRWNSVNIAALNASRDRLCAESQEALNAFSALQASRLTQRLTALLRCRPKRQGVLGTAFLYGLVLFGRA